MVTSQGVVPLNLQSDYLSATDNFGLLQTYASVLLAQQPLALPGNAGFAFEIETYQGQMKHQASNFNSQTMPMWIRLFTLATNFYALWQAMLTTELPLLQVADTNLRARTSVSQAVSELSFIAGTANQKASAFAADLRVRNDALRILDLNFNHALTTEITALGASASAELTNIATLQAAIDQNISDIVAGANKVGASVTGLLVGTLTTITGAMPGGGSATPSADFAVSGLEGAAQGVTQTSQARADLNANNVM